MKIQFLSAIVLTAMLVSGCGTTAPSTTQSFVKSTVQLGVAFGVSQRPEAIPYLRDYAAPVVCEAARGTNVQPAWIIAQLEANAAANQVKNEWAVMIFNSAFGIYEALYATWGADEVQNRAQLQAWLMGSCEGILAGLPAGTNAFRAQQQLPPHLRWP